MKERYLETGKIVNTHGIAGEVKILPWADAPDFLLDFDTLYIDGKPVKLLAARVHKNCVLAKLEGVDDVNAAMRLRDKVVSIDREDVGAPSSWRTSWAWRSGTPTPAKCWGRSPIS